MKKSVARLLAAFVVCVVCVVALRVPICRKVFPALITSLAGVPCQIGSVDIGIAGTPVQIVSLRLKNPPDFDLEHDPDLIKLSDAYTDYTWGFLFGRKLHLTKLSLSVDEIRIIRNRAGRLNIQSLKAFLPKGQQGLFAQIQIDIFDVAIRRVVYKDYTKTPHLVRTFDVNISERFEDITDVRAFTQLILKKALSTAGVMSVLSAAWAQEEIPSVCFDEACVSVELADTAESRQRGLMGREGLEDSRGMLFIFPVPEPHSFWMKNMRFPIDLIWMSQDGTVTAVTSDARPCSPSSCESFTAGGATRFVLEVGAGYAGSHGIQSGDKAVLPAGIASSPPKIVAGPRNDGPD
jgi:uncharacterized protein